jgi:hypothetical protein
MELLIIILVVVVVWLVWYRTVSSFTFSEIPKIIWTYWDGDELPEIVQKSIENWKRYSPDFVINVVTPSNLGSFLPEKDFSTFRSGDFVQRKVDLIRLYLIEKYGGIWSDASIAVRRSHDWVIDAQRQKGFQFMAYYRKGATSNTDYPVIENWFFAAVPGSIFVSNWKNEFERSGEYKEIKDYIADLKSKGVDLQEIPDPNYLTPYASAQYVMQKMMTPDEIKSEIYTVNSEDGPFLHSNKGGWDPDKSIKSLCDMEAPELPDVIKIYGNERRAIEGDEKLKCAYKIFD